MQWIEKVKQNIHNFNEFHFDIKSDLLRIKTKI